MTAALLYRHYSLKCPCGYSIPLPRPSREEIDGSLRQIRLENRKAVFVCPACGLVSAHYGQGIRAEMTVDIPSLFEAGGCGLVAIEVECDGENCESPKTVHAIQGTDKGTWQPNVAPKDWTFAPSAQC